MIRFFEDFRLKPYNTFGVDASARYFFEFTEPEDLDVFLQSNKSWQEEQLLLLGGGSNILFTKDFDGLVIRPNIPGLKEVAEDRQHVWVEAGAGEVWDEVVQFAVDMQLGGIENLSLIPGTVGAAPVQNIGAYGQEVSNVIALVKGYNLETGLMFELTAAQCGFSYRNSIFKQALKGKAIITSVVFRLDKFPRFNLGYSMVNEKVKERGEVTLHSVRDAVIDIRSSKLPNVKEMGNAGSFFKNPVVESIDNENIERRMGKVPVYPASDGKVKLAAGWLIEKAGWKGVRQGDVGVHDKQALVLINYGNATGKEIFEFSEKIRNSVRTQFGVELEREVICI
ncbi:MAG: UDP-N-acetylenolpyruvoylglucosamine reductase [Draconibacterium sp.]|nr:MAG: UDP-N-acetylenolpyruvoylglucosamine reductase [Draconibacterium sp.]